MGIGVPSAQQPAKNKGSISFPVSRKYGYCIGMAPFVWLTEDQSPSLPKDSPVCGLRPWAAAAEELRKHDSESFSLSAQSSQKLKKNIYKAAGCAAQPRPGNQVGNEGYLPTYLSGIWNS